MSWGNLLIQPGGCKSRLTKAEQGRSVASVAIHCVTGWCEAYTVRKQAMRISTKIVYCPDADAFTQTEGGIRQQQLVRGWGEIGGVSSPGHVSKDAGREPKRVSHPLPHQEERLWIGSGDTGNQGSTEGSTDGWLSSLTTS
jgi:hypothetical protein